MWCLFWFMTWDQLAEHGDVSYAVCRLWHERA